MILSHITMDNSSFVKGSSGADISVNAEFEEFAMSQYVHYTMTNHHHFSLSHPVAAVSDLFDIWRQRYVRRRELSQLTDADFHDVGASWSDFADEANKPFWRA